MKKIIVILLIIILAFSNCTKKEKIKAIATVGNLTVSLYEFEREYRFNPFLASVKSDKKARRMVLTTLIAEKLLAGKAYENKSDQRDLTQAIISQFETEAMIEQLW